MARFSAYVSDSDDDGQNSVSEVGQAAVREEELGRKQGAYRVAESEDSEFDSVEEEEEEEKDESVRSASPPAANRKAGDPSILPWARDVGVDPQRMHVMQSAFFRVPEEARAMQEIEAQTTAQSRRKLFLPNTLSRKHSRDSEGEGIRAESKQRKSFAHDIDPAPYRPTRKYARVGNAASAVNGNENLFVDAGLSVGRSFRVGWGPGGTLAHLGRLCGPRDSPSETANTSTVTITTIPLLSTSEQESVDRASKLLSHHLAHKSRHPPIVVDSDGVPCANPSPDLTFSSFASLFPSTDTSYEASLFRLGRALFDPLDLHLSDDYAPEVSERIISLHRRAALSDWLQANVASSVDADLRNNPGADWPSVVFSHLTGNQIAKACDIAIDAGNTRLSTLLSQCPGDEEFKEDLRAQLLLWREQRIDAHISEDVRRIYSLLAGVVDVLQGSKGTGVDPCPDLPIAKGLDWKRTFGLQLWFGQSMDASITDVFAAYQGTNDTTAPTPWCRESSQSESRSTITWRSPQGTDTPDLLFSLIRLFAEPNLFLSEVLTPFSYGASPLDYRLAWHLYIILSRCLHVRDLADRADPGPLEQNDGVNDHIEGHSPSADLLANSYAMQLERLGLVQEAAFVLLHIEGSAGRRRAIKGLLLRSAPRLDDYMLKGLCGSLRIPENWVNEAKAMHALDHGDMYSAYEHYLDAEMYNTAHDLAVLQLAPDVIIRKDMELLREIFQRFINQPVNEWHIRGKLFLDYAHAMIRLPELRAYHQVDAIPDASHATEIEEFSRNVPKLLTILPDLLPNRTDIRQTVAIAEMIAGLTLGLDQLRPLAIQGQLRSSLASADTRLRHVQAASLQRFMRTIDVS